LRTLGGVAADRQARIDQQVEPVGGLLDLRAALRPDRAQVFSARENGLDVVGDLGQNRTRRRRGEMRRLVRKEVLAADLGGDIAVADIGAASRRQALGVAAWRRNAVEVDRRL
jgi:hypothetical protein